MSRPRRSGDERIFKKWSKEENLLYAQFLKTHPEEFQRGKDRRSMNFFTVMSTALNIGKSNVQCRSHHQKMVYRYKTVDKIISKIEESNQISE